MGKVKIQMGEIHRGRGEGASQQEGNNQPRVLVPHRLGAISCPKGIEGRAQLKQPQSYCSSVSAQQIREVLEDQGKKKKANTGFSFKNMQKEKPENYKMVT